MIFASTRVLPVRLICGVLAPVTISTRAVDEYCPLTACIRVDDKCGGDYRMRPSAPAQVAHKHVTKWVLGDCIPGISNISQSILDLSLS